MHSLDDSQALSDRFAAAKLRPPSIETKRLLGDLQSRLFGCVSEPLRIGRFVVLRRLGAGGMGIVYRGYDAALNRNVALKLLHTIDRSPTHHTQATQRLRREARALARVDHPNVVAVYEVGEHDGATFIAMELVDGTTLASWQAAERRPWTAVVNMYLQAARGLAAAHAAGVIHRDFKPENILVGYDGRARVADFGLAGHGHDVAAQPSYTHALSGTLASLGHAVDATPASDTPQTDDPAASLTATGTLLGTPAYMAPEQHFGHHADARSDQFSFGLALYEGLCGRRAFAGTDAASLVTAMQQGALQPIPASVKLPRWLRRVMTRCLRHDPQARYPTMTDVVADLEAGLRRRRRTGWAATMLVAVAASGLTGHILATPTPSLCTQSAELLAPTWNDAVRTTTAAAFAASPQPFAATVWAQTERRLDAYAADWTAMHHDACASTHLRGEQSGELLTLRMRCLDRRRAEFSTLVEVLATADPHVVLQAVDAVDALTPVSTCIDSETLAAAQAVPDHPRDRAFVATQREALARAKVLRDAGQAEAAMRVTTEVMAGAQALAFRPLLAEAGLMLGSLEAVLAPPDVAATTLDQAFLDALACGHSDVAAWTAIVATHVVGSLGRRSADGRRWAALAAPLLAHSGDDPRARASLLANQGNIAVHDGDLVAARNHYEAALNLISTTFGDDDVMLARNLSNLATVHRRSGDHELALAAYARARQIFTTNLGPDHPALATLANNLGALHQTMGNHDAAERSYREILGLPPSALAPSSPTRGHAHHNLAELLLQQNHAEDAVFHADAAVTVWEQSRGPMHPLVATARLGLAHSQLALATPAATTAAITNLERAREILVHNAASPEALADVESALARISHQSASQD